MRVREGELYTLSQLREKDRTRIAQTNRRAPKFSVPVLGSTITMLTTRILGNKRRINEETKGEQVPEAYQESAGCRYWALRSTLRLRLAQCASSGISPGRPQDRMTLGEDGVRELS